MRIATKKALFIDEKCEYCRMQVKDCSTERWGRNGQMDGTSLRLQPCR